VAAQRGAAPARGQTAHARGQTQKPAPASGYNGPRTPDKKPDLNGIWQVVNTAHWNIEAHSASEGVPAGFSVVEGGTIPYQPGALQKRNENLNRMTADPLRSAICRACCARPIAVSVRDHADDDAHRPGLRVRPRDERSPDGTPPHMDDLISGWATRGRWEGDTLVVDTVSPRADLVDEAGNFHSAALGRLSAISRSTRLT
jgi:hypothetical protein